MKIPNSIETVVTVITTQEDLNKCQCPSFFKSHVTATLV